MSYKTDIDVVYNAVVNADIIDYTDEIKSKANFQVLIDGLCKDGLIGEKTYDNSYIVFNKVNKDVSLWVGNIRRKI